MLKWFQHSLNNWLKPIFFYMLRCLPVASLPACSLQYANFHFRMKRGFLTHSVISFLKPHITCNIYYRCVSEDTVVESVTESQTDSPGGPPSTKRRKLVEAEKSPCSETHFVPESIDVNKSLNKAHSNIHLEKADSTVADSFIEIKHNAACESDEEPKRKQIEPEVKSKVVNIPDSLDVSEGNHITADETPGFDWKGEKTIEHVQLVEMKTQVQHQDTEHTSLENINGNFPPANNQQDEAKHVHVPAGFLCSNIPRKVWNLCHFI